MSRQVPVKSDALQRAGAMSKALADAARRARFSTRSRRNFDAGGFSARRDARLMRLFAWASFVALVAIPSVAAIAYFGFIASDQYVAEAQFTVTSGDVGSKSKSSAAGNDDKYSSATGVPLEAVVQDTQIVVAYLESRAAVEALDARIRLRSLYGDEKIDVLARFPADASIERLVEYWRWMTKSSIKMPSGIVDFKVRAFTPQQAQLIANEVVSLSEKLINGLNERMFADAVSSADIEVKRAASRLGQVRADLERARNEEGLLDATRAADAIEKLLNQVRQSDLALRQEYNALSRSVSAESPQMRVMRTRIDASRAQIAELSAKLTNVRQGAPQTLTVSLTRFAALDLERQIAEKIYAGALETLETARLVAENRTMYLKTFVLPLTPEEPLYPRRILYAALVIGAGLAIWSALLRLVAVVRDNSA